MNTVITEKTNDGDVSFDVFNKLIHKRILFLNDMIDDGAATDIVAALLYLESINNQDKIELYINCEDGDIHSIFMIYDVMQMMKSPIQTICIGAAMFAPAIILAAGTKGMRYATRSSLMLISQLTSEGISHGDMTHAKISFDQAKRDNKKLIDIISKLTNKSSAKIAKDCARKFLMNPVQAKRYGIIDHIIEWKKGQ